MTEQSSDVARSRVRRKDRALRFVQILVGVTLFCLGASIVEEAVAARDWARLRESVEAIGRGDWLVFARLTRSVAGVWAAVFGAAWTLHGIAGLSRFVFTRALPADFEVPGEVREALAAQQLAWVLPGGGRPEDHAIHVARWLPIGAERSVFLSRSSRPIAQRLAAVVRVSARWVVILTVAWGVARAVRPNLPANAPSRVVEVATALEAVPFPWPLVAAAGAVGLLALAAFRRMLPRSAPEARVVHYFQPVTSPRNPTLIYQLFEDAARVLTRDEFPPRAYWAPGSDGDMHSHSGTTNFRGCVMLEQRPIPEPAGPRGAAVEACGGGVACLLAGFVVLASAREAAGLGPVLLVASVLAGVVLVRGGVGLVRAGAGMLALSRYVSTAITARFTGAVTRSQVTIGNQKRDAIQSQNETNRSELGVAYYTSRVLSEATTPDAPRYLVSMSPDAETEQDLQSLARAFRERAEVGISVAAPALPDPNVVDIVRINSLLATGKLPTLPPSDGAPPPKLPPTPS